MIKIRVQTIQEHSNGINPILKEILLKRGYSESELPDFFSWDLLDLPDLTAMIDLAKASKRIIKAINNDEPIGVYGDYDVDGSTSCSLLYHFFKMLDIKVQVFQPSRFVEGYGVHPSSIDQAIECGVKVLVTVDCGISNVATAEYALEKDIDLIITDHHKDATEKMPPAFAVVNPNRRDEPKTSELGKLAGVGVAFALALQIKNDLTQAGVEIPSIYSLLQFVAIGTICDMAYLSPMNIKLTRHGLKQLPTSNYPGLLCFFKPDERKVDFISSEKISFYVGPLINSKGRLEHPEIALKCLNAPTSDEGYFYHSQLETSNNERKFIQAEVFKSAKKQVLKSMDKDELLATVVYDPDWHEGVIGIVASKLVETFKVPAVVFTNSEQDGILKASARTAGGLNLFSLLDNLKEHFIKFGGHKAAAGLSLKKENYAIFKQKLHEQLKNIPIIERETLEYFDAEIRFEDINVNLIKDLDKLEPFGMGNARPVFRMSGFKLDSYNILKDKHVKWTFTHPENSRQKLQGISFNYIGKWGVPSPDEIFKWQHEMQLSADFTLNINRFNGNEYLQLMVNKVWAS